jgi:hypothetical protein
VIWKGKGFTRYLEIAGTASLESRGGAFHAAALAKISECGNQPLSRTEKEKHAKGEDEAD